MRGFPRTRFVVRPGKKVSLADDFDPADTGGLDDKSQAKALLTRGIERLAQQIENTSERTLTYRH